LQERHARVVNGLNPLLVALFNICSGLMLYEVCSAVKRLLTALFRPQALPSIEIAYSDALGLM
jgi:hypothetical protein